MEDNRFLQDYYYWYYYYYQLLSKPEPVVWDVLEARDIELIICPCLETNLKLIIEPADYNSDVDAWLLDDLRFQFLVSVTLSRRRLSNCYCVNVSVLLLLLLLLLMLLAAVSTLRKWSGFASNDDDGDEDLFPS